MRRDDPGRDWLQVIRSEYLEMPGLSLTLAQVQRLCGLDSESCHVLINEMVSVRFLRKTPRDCYVRVDISNG